MTKYQILSLAVVLIAAIGAASGAADPALHVEPVQDSDFYDNGQPPAAKVRLGRSLFFDKILSGNRNISCATCHHPTRGSGDALSLSLGEGAIGLAENRRVTVDEPVLSRVPRNAQPLYFLGAKAFTRLYHDGRVEKDSNNNWKSGFWSPAREQLPAGLDNVLAVQAMFPVISAVEMAGHKGENEIATAIARDELDGPEGAWALIARRLAQTPEYAMLFAAAFDDVNAAHDITMVHAANAIAAFEATAFRADNSPFDRYLETRDPQVLSEQARRGMDLFYREAACGRCHSGKFQTDQQFHAIAMPQIGPGKNDGFDRSYWRSTGFAGRLEDHGRYRETQAPEDRFRFRTPSLRNVEITGPWGHAGSYSSLEAVVRHHANPVSSLHTASATEPELPALAYVIERTASQSQLVYRPVNPERLSDFLERDTWVMRTPDLRDAIAEANELEPTALNDAQVADLIAFLESLTDPRSKDGRDLVPRRVPSGLPVAD